MTAIIVIIAIIAVIVIALFIRTSINGDAYTEYGFFGARYHDLGEGSYSDYPRQKKESSGPMKWDDIPTAGQDYEDSVIDQFPEADFDDPDTFDDDLG